MMLALVNGVRTLAAPGLQGVCPGCAAPVIPKCGAIRVHHWSHLRTECDPWWEPEGLWHREWKLRFPMAEVEVAFGPHRADIATPLRVIELQSSTISPEQIAAREAFYATVRPRGMVWLLNGTALESQFTFTQRDNYISFCWRRCPARWLTAGAPLCVDFGSGIFVIKKIASAKGGAAGWGYAMTQQEFIERFSK